MIRRLRESNSKEADDFFRNEINDFIEDLRGLRARLGDIDRKIDYFGKSGGFDFSDFEYLSKQFPGIVESNIEDIQFILNDIRKMAKEFK